jgi:hypothetical protein
MISRFHVFVAALAGVLVWSVAGAQVRTSTATSFVQRSTVHARPAARGSASPTGAVATGVPSSQHAGVIRISSSGQITSGFDPIANTVSFDGVPGLGFDYPHLAAISGAFRNDHTSHFDHDGHRGPRSFIPILFGGYPYYFDDMGYDQPEQQTVQQSQPQPQIIVIQQPVPAQPGADVPSDTGSVSAPVIAPQPASTIPDVGNFILVRRDGRILFASIFSIGGSQLQYVTPEGIRHTLAMSDLDGNATQQMNEARGTTVQIPN